MTRRASPTIALFPEASFGAALNCVGIAQALRAKGARPVFICHAGFSGVFADYGFQEYQLPTEEPLSDSERQSYWQAFVRRHLPHFRLSPIDQLETYVAPTWQAIVDTAVNAEAPLRQLLARLKPDAVVLDNVIMFPAIAAAGCPWARVVSCAETELPDAEVPPYLSGLGAGDPQRAAFEARYLAASAPAHDRFNRFRADCGLAPLPKGLFLETSPDLNLLLTPAIVRRERAEPLDPERFVYLEGCVRSEGPFEVPVFPRNGGPLVYVSFGSLGAMDVGLIERMLAVFDKLPARFIVNVGGLRDAYRAVPDNVYLDAWFPQPSVVAKSDLFIHHGGNNSFCEALRFGVPSLIMPYCWDGHDNAQRAGETGVGDHIGRDGWTEGGLERAILGLLTDDAMRARLRDNAAEMALKPGTDVAAQAILSLIRT
ncbi:MULTISPECIES: glycosyltransferase [unclassified Mesorhizobium]|uniref:nucleotide disphospho-sugar-binding domain-containing protein n=1 Tax=unclassified Mesorhizobium TaxID=325217 RepID=UPI000FD9C4C0|nr:MULTISPECIES: glycosyltransferase [unclassified Mesorhizobium]TGR38534.1 glycosyl transferase family 1 [bacterium M00.F.Ca.ET.199.01.1.1]TGU28000.1 glycosyl transferase family 1 [bacterium M00.F.Ca.ET.156.01.1.1]TGV83529.1 glycosyl transferase family 1 [Mesorhizobium sp. M00.F.Ca.ET.149.01.1.1]TGR21466.1 glycosyl transferase family 1 [Mesorhizobium sp. M8A.F.Ca.ET.202.01.1.1]TGR21896.1 glycosyl transferase family 1 [Mesorhizobium sp. M8A.F.Ca.ET.197.01.1.1]